MRTTLTGRGAAILVASSLFLAACGTATTAAPTTGGQPTDGAGAGTTVDVTLQEWAVVANATTAPAGDVTFNVTNSGPEDIHEFVIVKTDLGAGALPVDETGTVDEAGGGVEVIDEIEDIEVGASSELTVTLEPGAYVLLCNIYDETEQEAHYTMGMRIDFTVS